MNIKRSGFTRVSSLLLTLCLCAVCMTFPASASTPERMDMPSVILDDSWQSYDLPVDTYAYCPVYLEENGYLTLKVQTYYDSLHYVYLLDSDLETVAYSSIHGSGSASPETVDFNYFLTAGDYYVRVESWNDVSGLFKIRGSFTPAATDEWEPNDTFEQAMGLIPNDVPVRGFLSTAGTADFWSEPLPEGTQDFADYYVFTLQGAAWDVNIEPLESIPTDFHAVIYDSSHNKLAEEYLSETTSITLDFPTGTYYLAVESSNRASGQYAVSVTSSGVDPQIPAAEEYYEEETWEEEYPMEAEDDSSWEDYELLYGEDSWYSNLEDVQTWIDEIVPTMEKLDPETSLPVQILEYDNSFYALFPSTEEDSFTWMEGLEFSELMHGHLATVNSPGEQEFLIRMVQEAGVNAWLGGYKTNHSWKWVTAEVMDTGYWYENEPNGSGDFLQLYSMGSWDDTFNENTTVTAFICEWN